MDVFRESFRLFGLVLRWVDCGEPPPVKDDDLILIREPTSFPEEQIRWLRRGTMATPWFGRKDQLYAYRFDGVADFLFPPEGKWLRVFVRPHADPWAFSFVLTRGVLPRLLHLRGVPCLHASAVRVGTRVVAFMGRSGVGKSTLAAGLVARGFTLVSDDVLPLRHAGTDTLAGPGIPELRLTHAALELLGIEGAQKPGPGQTKWRYYPPSVAHNGAPLSALYLVASPDAPAETTRDFVGARLPAQRALIALIENSFWLSSQETKALAIDLDLFARIARSVEVAPLRFDLSARGFGAITGVLRSSYC